MGELYLPGLVGGIRETRKLTGNVMKIIVL